MLPNKTVFICAAALVVSAVLAAFALATFGSPSPTSEQQTTLTEQQAIQIGRVFLDSRNYTTGKVLFSNLTEMNPVKYFYWHELFGLDKPNVQDTELSWDVKFEQARFPGHFFEVCIDANSGAVVGGAQCR